MRFGDVHRISPLRSQRVCRPRLDGIVVDRLKDVHLDHLGSLAFFYGTQPCHALLR